MASDRKEPRPRRRSRPSARFPPLARHLCIDGACGDVAQAVVKLVVACRGGDLFACEKVHALAMAGTLATSGTEPISSAAPALGARFNHNGIAASGAALGTMDESLLAQESARLAQELPGAVTATE